MVETPSASLNLNCYPTIASSILMPSRIFRNTSTFVFHYILVTSRFAIEVPGSFETATFQKTFPFDLTLHKRFCIIFRRATTNDQHHMSRKALRLRGNWQTKSGKVAQEKEDVFFDLFSDFFSDSPYQIERSPKDFNNIYYDWPVQPRDQENIYVPPSDEYRRHGFVPDFVIANAETNKRIYVELKRQDGWVEGGRRSDGRGNAHERMCKYFSPGLTKLLRDYSNVSEDILPFWTVFCGNITRDPCRVREVTFWFQDYVDNYFFWREADVESVAVHFAERIAPHLD